MKKSNGDIDSIKSINEFRHVPKHVKLLSIYVVNLLLAFSLSAQIDNKFYKYYQSGQLETAVAQCCSLYRSNTTILAHVTQHKYKQRFCPLASAAFPSQMPRICPKTNTKSSQLVWAITATSNLRNRMRYLNDLVLFDAPLHNTSRIL